MDINERIAIEVYGWKWIAFFDTPIRGTPCYPEKTWVRQLMSATQLENPRWQGYLKEHQVRESDGTEPLAYGYCSSGGSVAALTDWVGLLREADAVRAAILATPNGVSLLKAIGRAKRKKS